MVVHALHDGHAQDDLDADLAAVLDAGQLVGKHRRVAAYSLIGRLVGAVEGQVDARNPCVHELLQIFAAAPDHDAVGIDLYTGESIASGHFHNIGQIGAHRGLAARDLQAGLGSHIARERGHEVFYLRKADAVRREIGTHEAHGALRIAATRDLYLD